MSTSETYRGVVHGSTVVLTQSPNLPDGVEVNVIIERHAMGERERKDRLESLFGTCKDDTEDLDRFLKWNEIQRRRDRPGLEA